MFLKIKFLKKQHIWKMLPVFFCDYCQISTSFSLALSVTCLFPPDPLQGEDRTSTGKNQTPSDRYYFPVTCVSVPQIFVDWKSPCSHSTEYIYHWHYCNCQGEKSLYIFQNTHDTLWSCPVKVVLSIFLLTCEVMHCTDVQHLSLWSNHNSVHWVVKYQSLSIVPIVRDCI